MYVNCWSRFFMAIIRAFSSCMLLEPIVHDFSRSIYLIFFTTVLRSLSSCLLFLLHCIMCVFCLCSISSCLFPVPASPLICSLSAPALCALSIQLCFCVCFLCHFRVSLLWSILVYYYVCLLYSKRTILRLYRYYTIYDFAL